MALGGYVIYMVGHPKGYTLDPVDLAVYRSGGLIVRHIRPYYDPHLASPLYDWVGYGKLHLPFTYTPFAAVAFALVSFVPYQLSLKLSVAVDLVSLLAVVWFTLGGLGYRRARRSGPARPCWARRRSCGPSRCCGPSTWARSTWSCWP